MDAIEQAKRWAAAKAYKLCDSWEAIPVVAAAWVEPEVLVAIIARGEEACVYEFFLGREAISCGCGKHTVPPIGFRYLNGIENAMAVYMGKLGGANGR